MTGYNKQRFAFTRNQPLLWGLLHGLNDLTAGFMLANYTLTHAYSQSFMLLVIYSIIGFGGQLPVGFWVDHKKQVKPFALVAIIALILAILLYFVNGYAAIILAGIASAFVHVTGGTVCLQLNDNKSAPLALFTAPGILGLTLGGVLGKFPAYGLWFVLAGVISVSFFILRNKLPVYKPPQKKQNQLDLHDWLMLGLLLIMCFRSFIFDIVNHVAYQYPNGIVIIGISAFAGKVLGGLIADKIGWKRFVYISLPLALLLMQLGKENIYALAFGIACLQSSVPITLLLMSNSLPQYPATATALSLGTTVAFAGLPIFLLGDIKVIYNNFNNRWLTFCIFTVLFLGWMAVDKLLFKKLKPQPPY
jgi:MFS transporter, FSR family, fosmidomycin resistance protein